MNIFKRKDIYGHPGPQKELLISIFKPTLILALIILFIVIVFLQVLETSGLIVLPMAFPINMERSIIILISLVALSFTVRHFSLSVTPLMNYEYRNNVISDMGFSGKVFQTRVKNSGNGIGVISHISYSLKINGDNNIVCTCDPNEIIKKFNNFGFVKGLNYEIFFMSKGYAFSSKEEKAIFEGAPEIIVNIESLDLKVRVKSVLGNEFEKYIYAIPHDKFKSFPGVSA